MKCVPTGTKQSLLNLTRAIYTLPPPPSRMQDRSFLMGLKKKGNGEIEWLYKTRADCFLPCVPPKGSRTQWLSAVYCCSFLRASSAKPK